MKSKEQVQRVLQGLCSVDNMLSLLPVTGNSLCKLTGHDNIGCETCPLLKRKNQPIRDFIKEFKP